MHLGCELQQYPLKYEKDRYEVHVLNQWGLERNADSRFRKCMRLMTGEQAAVPPQKIEGKRYT